MAADFFVVSIAKKRVENGRKWVHKSSETISRGRGLRWPASPSPLSQPKRFVFGGRDRVKPVEKKLLRDHHQVSFLFPRLKGIQVSRLLFSIILIIIVVVSGPGQKLSLKLFTFHGGWTRGEHKWEKSLTPETSGKGCGFFLRPVPVAILCHVKYQIQDR